MMRAFFFYPQQNPTFIFFSGFVSIFITTRDNLIHGYLQLYKIKKRES